jgi:archaeal flagellar protein FlaJ
MVERSPYRRILERGVLVGLGIGSLLLLMGTLSAGFNLPVPAEYAAWSAVAGVAILLISIELAHPLDTLRTIRPGESGGRVYDQQRHWRRFKVTGILLNLLTIFGILFLLVALLVRLGVLTIDLHYDIITPTLHFFALVLGLTTASAAYNSLRTPFEREANALRVVIFQTLTIVGFAFVIIAAALARPRFNAELPIQFRHSDIPFFLIAAAVTAATALVASRAIPTLLAVFKEEKEFYRVASFESRRKSVILPTLIAFALLFIVLMVVIVFQLTVADLFADAGRNAAVIGIILAIAIAFFVSVAIAVVLARREEPTPLFRRYRGREEREILSILLISGSAAAVFFIVAFLIFVDAPIGLRVSHERWLDLFTFALLAILGPYGFYEARRARRVRRLEERFPDFLRDLAASRKAGLTLANSITIAARGEYGELTPEIQKMADQLSWNVPFEEALRNFGDRVKTPLVQRAVSLIIEAGRTGGHVTDVLVAAATDAREIKNLENERRTTITLYSIVVYIVFFVFLVVVAVLDATFVPEILRSRDALNEDEASSFTTINFDVPSADAYRAFYFLSALSMAVGNGLVAGLMQTGKVRSGLRHAFFMVLITYVTFTFLRL